MQVYKYNRLLNYASGNTMHFENNRSLREKELIRVLGVGFVIARFLVYRGDGLQIQEILDNGIINVYSHTTHKKITTFAPNPNRLISLYEAVGEVIPDSLLAKSELNSQNNYNETFDFK